MQYISYIIRLQQLVSKWYQFKYLSFIHVFNKTAPYSYPESPQYVGGTSRAKSSGTSQYIKCSLCHVLIFLYMDKTSREEQPKAFERCGCVCVCVRVCALRCRVMKQPGSRIMFVLTEASLQSPHYSRAVNKDRTQCVSQTGSPRYLESRNKCGSQQLVEDAVHVCFCSHSSSVGNTTSQWLFHGRNFWLKAGFQT